MNSAIEAVFEMKAADALHLLEGLSRRESEVAGLLAMGHSNREIAERLGISVKTGDIHRGRVKDKLQTTVQGIGRIWFLAKLSERLK